jgi:hypothetical protein
MTDQPTAQIPIINLPPYVPLPPRPPRRGLRIAGMIVGGLALLLAGVGIGATGATKTVT